MMASHDHRITLMADTDAVVRCIAELSALELPLEVGQRLVGAIEAGAKVFVFEADSRAAAGADHLVMRAKPSDLLLVFMAAAGAANPDLRLVEDALRHIESSVPVKTIAKTPDGRERPEPEAVE